jgi:tetratricopeptide repeat protein/glycosyl transferase family 9 (putative heptosyltransferase)
VNSQEAINLGAERQRAGLLAEAESLYRHALLLRPDLAEAHYNLGTALDQMGRWDEAIAALRQAVALRPDLATAHWNLAAMLLRQGDLPRGWEEYEWRWKIPELRLSRVTCPQPQWNGEELMGRRILVYAEQGFGDTIQFARYVPLVARLGGRVMLGCRRELTALLGRLDGVERCLPQPGPAPADFSFHCTLPSLPRIFGTTTATIPWSGPYLAADAAKAAAWQARLRRDGRRRIGLVWAGRPTHPNDLNRSIAPDRLRPLADVPDVQWFSLQKGPAAGRISDGLAALTDWTAEMNDFDDTAALLANLDGVICVDTSVAHLAAALGRPTWVLLPFVPDWRWMLERSDSPWYPTMRLFRQPAAGDWDSVLREVVAALRRGEMSGSWT